MGNEVKNPNVARLLISGTFAVAGGVIGGLAAGLTTGGMGTGAGIAKGFAVGWQVGGIVGRVLVKDPREPSTADYQNQKIAYGGAIPIVYGKIKLAGNVIWSTVPTEYIDYSTGVGAGRVFPDVEVGEDDNFAYASFAIAFCEGPMAYIEKIYANDILIWKNDGNLSTQVSYETVIYLGSLTQVIDPVMEADVGIGNCPAYRGICYVRFTNMNLFNFGNNFPNITAVVVSQGVESFNKQVIDLTDNDPAIDVSYVLSKVDPVVYWLGRSSRMLKVIDREDGTILKSIEMGTLIDAMPDTLDPDAPFSPLSDISGPVEFTGKLIVDEETDTLVILCRTDSNAFFVYIPADTLVPLYHSYDRFEAGVIYEEGIMVPKSATQGEDRKLYIMHNTTCKISLYYIGTELYGNAQYNPLLTNHAGTIPGPDDQGYSPAGDWEAGTPCIGSGGIVWWVISDDADDSYFLLVSIKHSLDNYFNQIIDDNSRHVIYDQQQEALLCYGGVSGRVHILYVDGTSLTTAIDNSSAVNMARGYQRANAMANREFSSGSIYVFDNDFGTESYIHQMNTVFLTLMKSFSVDDFSLDAALQWDSAFDPITNCMWNGYRKDLYKMNLLEFTEAPYTEGAVIQDIMFRCGLSANDVNTTQLATLTQQVLGYCIARVTSAQAALEPLRKRRFLDIFEEDGKLTAKQQTNQPLTFPELDKIFSPPERGRNLNFSVSVTGIAQYTSGISWVTLGFAVGDRIRIRGFPSDNNNAHSTILSFSGGNLQCNVGTIRNLSGTNNLSVAGGQVVNVRTWIPFPLETKEFGVSIDGGGGKEDADNPEIAIVETRIPELAIPTRITLNYARNAGKQTEVSVTYSRNTHPTYHSTLVEGEASIDVPMVLHPQFAKTLAKKWLSKMWSERSSYQATMDYRFALLNVGDVILIPFTNIEQYVRIVDLAEVSPYVRAYNLLQTHPRFSTLIDVEDPNDYDPDENLQRPSKTIGHVIDSHLYNPKEDNAGWYVGAVAAQTNRPWNRANIFQGKTLPQLENVGEVLNQTTIGYLKSELKDTGTEGLLDLVSTIDVVVRGGTLTSTTIDSMLDGLNLMLLGREYISFVTVTLVGTNTYRLSQLYRYRFGTKPYGNHKYGEPFMIMHPKKIARVQAAIEEIDESFYFKVVTAGLRKFSHPPIKADLEGLSLMCLAPYPYPSHYTVYDGSKEFIYICFLPISRLGGDLVDGFDTTIIESENNYEIEIRLTATDALLRTILTSNPNQEGIMDDGNSGEAVWLDTEQLSDLGGHYCANEEVYFVIYQISPVMGRGYPLTVSFYK